MMLTLELNDYQLTWAQYLKGVGQGAQVMWLMMR